MKNINIPFIKAVKANNIEKVKYYLTSPELPIKADIHYKNSEKKSAILLAVEYEHIGVVKYLLESKDLNTHANVTDRTTDGYSLLIIAAQKRNVELLKYLLTNKKFKNQIDINETDNHGFSALNYSIFQRHNATVLDEAFNVIKYLLTSKDLDKHANLHNNSDDLLRQICYFNHLDIATYLLTSPELKEKADICAKDNREKNALFWILENKEHDFFKNVLTTTMRKENDFLEKESTQTMFLTLCEHYHKTSNPDTKQIIQYFLFDIELILTPKTLNILEQKESIHYQEVREIINIRNNMKNLNMNLPEKKTSPIKRKI